MLNRLRTLLRRARGFLLAPVQTIDRGTQVLLALNYKCLLADGAAMPAFSDVGFRVYSQHDEDGILLYIFSIIGTTDKRLVDLGCSTVRNSNSANLLINHGWTGLLVDGNERGTKTAREFYAESPDTREWPPQIVPAFITAENVNGLIRDNGYSGDLDLLSIDLDGVDYWIWKAIDCVNPRVVVVEYQNVLGPDRSLTVPYRPDYSISDYPVNAREANYVGASLAAFVKLAGQKGYRLAGCNRYCYNAFFVRRGLGDAHLPEVAASECFGHPLAQAAMKERYPKVKDMEWTEV